RPHDRLPLRQGPHHQAEPHGRARGRDLQEADRPAAVARHHQASRPAPRSRRGLRPLGVAAEAIPSARPSGDTSGCGSHRRPGAVSRRDGRGRAIRARFLVDTGAVYSVLPKRVWHALGLGTERTAEFSLADGSSIGRGVSECRFTLAGMTATSPVVLGEADEGPLLGAVTLETLGLMVN